MGQMDLLRHPIVVHYMMYRSHHHQILQYQNLGKLRYNLGMHQEHIIYNLQNYIEHTSTYSRYRHKLLHNKNQIDQYPSLRIILDSFLGYRLLSYPCSFRERDS